MNPYDKIDFLKRIKSIGINNKDQYGNAENYIEVPDYNKLIKEIPEITTYFESSDEDNTPSSMYGRREVYRRKGLDDEYKAAIQRKIDELTQQAVKPSKIDELSLETPIKPSVITPLPETDENRKEYEKIKKRYTWSTYPFIDAVKNNNIRQLRAVLLYKNFWNFPSNNINKTDTENKTALTYAIENLNHDMINMLLLNGAFINGPLSDEKSPLEYAIEIGDRAVVETLLYYKPNASSINVSGIKNEEIKHLIEITQIQTEVDYLNSIKEYKTADSTNYIQKDDYNKLVEDIPGINNFFNQSSVETGIHQMMGSEVKTVYRRTGDDTEYNAAIQSKIDELYRQMPIKDKDNKHLAQLLPFIGNKKRVCINNTNMGISTSGQSCGTLSLGYPDSEKGKYPVPPNFYMGPEKIKTLIGGRRKLKRTRRNRRKNRKSKSRKHRV